MPTELILRNYIITSQLAARPNRGAKRRSNGGTSDSKTPRVRFAAPFPRVETHSEITSPAPAIRKSIANVCEKFVTNAIVALRYREERVRKCDSDGTFPRCCTVLCIWNR